MQNNLAGEFMAEITDQRIEEAVQDGEDAFWAVISE
jgi:hypothetical protein